MKKIWERIKIEILKWIFPEDIKCIFCGRDIPNFEEKAYCEECEKILPLNDKHRCLICAEPIENDATVCDRCQKRKHNFKKAYCPFIYDGIVKNAVLRYKDSNQRYLAKTFARYMVKDMAGLQVDVITYIPMTKKKQRQRSFNQSKLLAEEIGKILNKPVISMFEKTKEIKAQKYLTAKEREKAIEGLYTYNKTKISKEAKVLIVDDVITTGSTVNYCAGLIKNKVSGVFVCAVAKTMQITKINKF